MINEDVYISRINHRAEAPIQPIIKSITEMRCMFLRYSLRNAHYFYLSQSLSSYAWFLHSIEIIRLGQRSWLPQLIGNSWLVSLNISSISLNFHDVPRIVGIGCTINNLPSCLSIGFYIFGECILPLASSL